MRVYLCEYMWVIQDRCVCVYMLMFLHVPMFALKVYMQVVFVVMCVQGVSYMLVCIVICVCDMYSYVYVVCV